MRAREITTLGALVIATGCVGHLEERTARGREAPGPAPGEWTMSIDTSASDRYLPPEMGTAAVRGVVTASEGVQSVLVGPDAARTPADSGGSFQTTSDVGAGYSLIEVQATDRAGHVVDGHRSVLRAGYTPEGELLGDSVVIAASGPLLDGLASGASGLLGGLDLSAFITPGTALMEDGPCRLYVDDVSHGFATLSLSPTDDGRLRATATVPDIAVGFSGQCNALGQAIDVDRGSEADETTVELSMILEAIEPPPGACVGGFTSSDVNVSITSFDLDLRLSGCGLLCLAGELVGEIAEGLVRGMLEDRFNGMVGGLVDPLLRDLTVLDETRTLDFLDTPVDVGLCLTGLEPSPEGQLMANIGTRVSGPGGIGIPSPGAPSLPSTLPPSRPGTMSLDPALVSQILYSVWNGGAFAIPDVGALSEEGEGLGFSIDALSGLVPELRPFIQDGRVTRGAPLAIGIDAQMAPLVRAATPEEAAGGADMFIELGDLRLSLGASGMTLFEIATHVRLAVSLEPTADGALTPVLIEDLSSTTTWLIDSAVPMLPARSATALTDLVDGLIVVQLSPLLAGAAIELPDLGVPLMVGDVSPTEGGYLEVELSVGPAPAP